MEGEIEKISSLVLKYKEVRKNKEEKTYSEEDTINGFILPLFNLLGWDTSNKNEVSSQDHIKGSGRPDYNFKINGITQFYLEAKKLSADLDNEDFAFQVINYSWNKGVTYAVLTDFEGIKVFNAQRIDRTDLMDKLVFEVFYENFIEDFEILKLLSKQAFKEKLLDTFAEKHGKKEKTVSVATVTKKLNEDIRWCRERLTDSFEASNEIKKIPKDLLDEGVQKLLDRLIFLRVAEDRGVEPNILKNLLREVESSGKKHAPFEVLKEKFRELDLIYNSNLFSEHVFESWEEYGGALKDVINKLYGKKGYYEYNFKEMSADVLGSVYENYLSHKLSATEIVNRNLFQQSGEKVLVHKDAKKRKEQGIFYTPPFVVEYIVNNALKPVLDKCKSVSDLKKIKVLDPSCGSGSFLIKALEAISEKYREFSREDQYVKREIILENIYGVDLDKQAVEIARLNLLINSLDVKEYLPKLDKNIKNGNSLISGTEEDLKKQFGKNWRDKKPFNWQEEFPEVFEQGGFDVIIGNPPYVIVGSDDETLPYFKNNYLSSNGGKVNLYKVFIEKSINLLKNNGWLGFICPSNYLSSSDSKSIRKIILEETNIVEIIEYSEKEAIFKDVTQALTTIVLNKTKDRFSETRIFTKKLGKSLVNQADFLNNSNYEFVSSNFLIKKLNKFNDRFEILLSGYQGEINVSTKKEFFTNDNNKGFLPLLRGNLIDRYKIIDEFSEYCPVSIDNRKHHDKERVVFQEVSNQQQARRIKATIISNVLCGHTTNYCFPNNQYDIKSILGLINSKVFNYYFKFFNNTNHVPIGEIKKIPIPDNFYKKQDCLVGLVDNILHLKRELQKISENSDKWNDIKSEIEKNDQKIDREVYKLYNLTDEEVKIIEEN